MAPQPVRAPVGAEARGVGLGPPRAAPLAALHEEDRPHALVHSARRPPRREPGPHAGGGGRGGNARQAAVAGQPELGPALRYKSL